jgi:AcrR family transcriptional regulator
MRLTAQHRREQLIKAAMRLFSEQGFHGTTTRQIAEAAGVNEAIIFRHFASKEELYWAVVSDRIRSSGRRQKIEEYLASGQSDLEVLASIAETLLARTREDTALTRLLLFSSLRSAELSDQLFRTYISEGYELLSNYIKAGIEQGRFRQVDPLIAARGFLGMITYHILVQEIFGGERHQKFASRAVGRQLAEMWLNGVAAVPAKEARQSGNHSRAGYRPELVAAVLASDLPQQTSRRRLLGAPARAASAKKMKGGDK